MKPVICLEMVYPGSEPGYKIQKIAEHGFQYVEMWGWQDKDIANLISACLETGVRVVNFGGQQHGSLVAADTHDVFLIELKKSVSTASKLDCHILTILTNELAENGSVRYSYDDISSEDKYQNVRQGLKKALEVIPKDMTLVLEPLNTTYDYPGYYLSDIEIAASLVRGINDPRLKVLCDFYHARAMNEELSVILHRYGDTIGHIHLADFPGRHEPGTGSISWPSVLDLLKKKGYPGYVGFEYAPLYDSDESLHIIRRLWERMTA